MKYLTLLVLVFYAAISIADDFKSLMNQGVKLHDQGKYGEAIKKYHQALEIDKDNATALYELSYSYMANKQFKQCYKTATRGLKKNSSHKKRFYVTAASCLSGQGKFAKAISLFEKGLKQFPKDAYLNMNIAVTLSKQKKYKKAIEHLKVAIKNEPKYATPYFYIAELYRFEGYRVPSIYFFLKYTMLEPSSNRSKYAAKAVFHLLESNVKKDASGDTKITISETPKDEGDFSALEMMISLSAAANDNKKASIADNKVKILAGFVQVSSELKDKKLATTFTWKHAANKAVKLNKHKEFSTFAYYLAAMAELDGARDWLTRNKKRIKNLDSVMKEIM